MGRMKRGSAGRKRALSPQEDEVKVRQGATAARVDQRDEGKARRKTEKGKTRGSRKSTPGSLQIFKSRPSGGVSSAHAGTREGGPFADFYKCTGESLLQAGAGGGVRTAKEGSREKAGPKNC